MFTVKYIAQGSDICIEVFQKNIFEQNNTLFNYYEICKVVEVRLHRLLVEASIFQIEDVKRVQ